MDEKIYIKSLQAGDTQVFREIFEEYHTRLCFFARTILPAGESPEDVVQEAFIHLWQKRTHFHEEVSVKAFLYITVKNYCLNIYKHDKIARRYSDLLHQDEADEITAMDHIIESETIENIFQALQKLPSGCRNVLQLSYFQELKNKEIAKQLQISINTVKTQKKRALHLLRAILKVTSMWL